MSLSVNSWFQSWSDPWSATTSTLTLQHQKSLGRVFICFVSPGCNYVAGQKTFAGTGLQFSSDFNVIAQSIKYLFTNYGVKVYLSVGGATYTGWSSFNPAGILALVTDLGAYGVEIDYEGQSSTELNMVLQTWFKSSKVNTWLASWSTGAFKNNEAPGGPYEGIDVMAITNFGANLQGINIMSYDAGPTFDPKAAFLAYRKLYKGLLHLGIEVPPESWGGHVVTLDEVKDLTLFVYNQQFPSGGPFGLSIWAIQKAGPPSFLDILDAINTTLDNASANGTSAVVPDPPPAASSTPTAATTPVNAPQSTAIPDGPYFAGRYFTKFYNPFTGDPFYLPIVERVDK